MKTSRMHVLDTFIKKYINMRNCFKFITPLSKGKVTRVTSHDLPYRKTTRLDPQTSHTSCNSFGVHLQ